MEMPGTPEYAAMLKECIRLKLEGRFDEAAALETKMRGNELVLTKEQLAEMHARTPDVVVDELDPSLPGFGFMAKEHAEAIAAVTAGLTEAPREQSKPPSAE